MDSITRKKVTIASILFFIVMVVIINIVGNKTDQHFNQLRENYLSNLDIKLKGQICNIDRLEYNPFILITIKILESNYSEYDDRIGNRLFCLINDDLAIISLNIDDYNMHDIVEIGYNENYYFQSLSSDGHIKVKLKKEELLIPRVVSVFDKMQEMILTGCSNNF